MADTTDTFDFVEIQLDDAGTVINTNDLPAIDWDTFFTFDGGVDTAPIIVSQPEPGQELTGYVDPVFGPEIKQPTMADGDVFHFDADDGLMRHIEHFDAGDKIELDGSAFGLAAGALPGGFLHYGVEASGHGAQIVYDPEHGWLLFSPNGASTGDEDSGAPNLDRTFATMDNHPTLSASDFVVV